MTTSQIENKNIFVEDWFFRDLGFPSVILVNKPLKALCQLQNGVTSSLPPFIVDLLTFKDYPRSNSFFRCASISWTPLKNLWGKTVTWFQRRRELSHYSRCVYLRTYTTIVVSSKQLYNSSSRILVPIIQQISSGPISIWDWIDQVFIFFWQNRSSPCPIFEIEWNRLSFWILLTEIDLYPALFLEWYWIDRVFRFFWQNGPLPCLIIKIGWNRSSF